MGTGQLEPLCDCPLCYRQELVAVPTAYKIGPRPDSRFLILLLAFCAQLLLVPGTWLLFFLFGDIVRS